MWNNSPETDLWIALRGERESMTVCHDAAARKARGARDMLRQKCAPLRVITMILLLWFPDHFIRGKSTRRLQLTSRYLPDPEGELPANSPILDLCTPGLNEPWPNQLHGIDTSLSLKVGCPGPALKESHEIINTP